MENKSRFPGLGWLSSRLSRKFIVLVVLLALFNWVAVMAFFASYLDRAYSAALGPEVGRELSQAVFWGTLGLNLLVLLAGAALLFFLAVAPVVRLRKMMREYSEQGKAPERTGRSDEIGRLQNTFADLVKAVAHKERAERQLIASISHDIKTPLTSVLGYSERLRSNQISSERQEQYLDLIHEKALHLKAVVDEFDDYLDEGLRDGAPMVLVSAGELCRRLQEEYGDELEDVGVDFQVECLCPEAKLICSWEHMRRFFGNLISNSMQHAGAKQLALRLQCRLEEGRLTLRFQDNGKGVPPELLERIFDPLYTSDRGRKVSGLGLSICKSIIKAHGGAIHGENAPEGGLVIQASLPLVEW